MEEKQKFKGKFWDFLFKGKPKGKVDNTIEIDENEKIFIPMMTKREVMLRYAPVWKSIMFFCIPTVILMLTQGSYAILDKFLALQFATDHAIHNQEYIKAIITGNGNFNLSILANTFLHKTQDKTAVDIFNEFFKLKDGSGINPADIISSIRNGDQASLDNIYNQLKDNVVINPEKMKQYINLTTQYTMQTYNIALSFTQLLAIGAGMHYAVEYGRRNREKLHEISGNGFVFAIMMSFLIGLVIFSISFRPWGQVLILSQMGSQRNLVIEALAWKDVQPLIYLIPLMFLAYFTMNMVRSEGRMIHIMIMTITSLPINCIVSIIAMKYLNLELFGAQLGTMVTFGYQVGYSMCIMFFSKISYSKFGWRDIINLKTENLFYSFKAGIPNFVIYFAVVINSYVSTALVIKLPETTPTIADNGGASILQELLSAMSPWNEFILSACIGLNQGVRTMIAYNYGAQKNERIISILKRSSWLMFGWFTFIFILIVCAGPSMMTMFNFPEQYISYGSQFYWYQFTYFMMYPFASLTYIALGLFQGVGRSIAASISSSLRSLTIFFPLVIIGFFISKLTGNPMWYFLIIGLTDLICGIIILPMLYAFYYRAKQEKRLESKEENDITKLSYLKYLIEHEGKENLRVELEELSQSIIKSKNKL